MSVQVPASCQAVARCAVPPTVAVTYESKPVVRRAPAPGLRCTEVACAAHRAVLVTRVHLAGGTVVSEGPVTALVVGASCGVAE